jgi:sterol desaturase/sphingolipid hydroxylase (fatty acid hydroxylase superfamily)
MNFFAISFLVMLSLVLVELAILKWAGKQTAPWKDVIFNLNSGHILMWVFRGIEVLGFGLLLQHLSLHWVDQWHVAWQWVFAFIGWDFCFYWMHRMHHKLPIFWAVHVVHHQGEHFNLSLGIRNSWYSSLTSFLFVAILAVLGVPLEIFIAVSSFHYSVQFYNHNALVGKSGWLDKIMVTPSNHRVHHGMDSAYVNKNFGGTLLIWDKLFGTYQAERDDIEMRYGVNGSVSSNNPLWANNSPLQRFVQTHFPSLQNLAKLTVPDGYIGSGGVIIFGMVIYYVNADASMSGWQQFALFALIFSATVAIGGMSDERRWGLLGWIALSVLPFVYVLHFGLYDPWVLALFSAWLLHGAAGLRLLFNRSGHSLLSHEANEGR